jgi:hypothetical protein
MVTRILLASRRRLLDFPGEAFGEAVKSAISDGYTWFKELAIKKVRPSKTPAKAIATWQKIWNSSLRKAMDGHEKFNNLVGDITKLTPKFENFEGTVPEEPLKKNSLNQTNINVNKKRVRKSKHGR